jgi:hypothetical protein
MLDISFHSGYYVVLVADTCHMDSYSLPESVRMGFYHLTERESIYTRFT